MIIDLPDTTTSAVNRRLVHLRETGGAVALGRVMTLVIPTEDGQAESAIRAANDASREHPCRVIAVVRGNKRGVSRLDAQIRVGGDAGASEVVVLRLYGQLADHGASTVVPLLLPDAPIVTWWPGEAPEDPVQDPFGRMAQRRITDASQGRNPTRTLHQRGSTHSPGDTDLVWTRITRWRALLAASLDEPPFEAVTAVTVTGAGDSASTDILAAWLTLNLKCPVTRVRTANGTGMVGVTLERPSGPIELVRPDGNIATLNQPGQPERRIALPRREDTECLVEELRRLDPDDVFADVVTRGMAALARNGSSTTAKAAARKVSGRSRMHEAAQAKSTPEAAASSAKQHARKPGGGKDGTPRRPPTSARKVAAERRGTVKEPETGQTGGDPSATPEKRSTARKGTARKSTARRAQPGRGQPRRAPPGRARPGRAPRTAGARRGPRHDRRHEPRGTDGAAASGRRHPGRRGSRPPDHRGDGGAGPARRRARGADRGRHRHQDAGGGRRLAGGARRGLVPGPPVVG